MKEKSRFIKPLIILFLALPITGCINNTNKPNSFIQGEILNSESDQLILSFYDYSDTSFLQINNFYFELHLKNPTYLTLQNKKSFARIFLKPGDTLHLKSFSENVFDSIIFKGSSKIANNYLYEKTRHLKKVFPLQELYDKNPEEFKKAIDSIFIVKKHLLDSLVPNKASSNNTFITLEKKALQYEKAKLLLEYPLLSPCAYKIDSKSYFDFIDQLALNDSNLLYIYEYSHFVGTYIEWLTNKEISGRTDLYPHDITLTKMQIISRNFSTGKVKNQLLYNTLNDHVRFYGLKNAQHLFKTFEFQCSNHLLKEKLLKPYQQYLALNKGKKAPDIKLLNLNSETLFLEDFKGSYLYIDVWATWCKPCLQEVPHFEELKTKYQNKNIEFISISIDDKAEKWINYCKKKKLNKNHFWVANKKGFLDNYMIKTIPHFIIIDPNGNIINIDAQRPSENKNAWLNELPNKPVS